MKAIRIEQQQDFIPVVIGDLEFKFHVTDENLLKFETEIQEHLKKIIEIDSTSDQETLQKAKSTLREAIDALLGEGAFEAIYKQVPSIIVVAGYYAQIIFQLGEAIDSFGVAQIDRASKYKKGSKDYNNKAQQRNHGYRGGGKPRRR